MQGGDPSSVALKGEVVQAQAKQFEAEKNARQLRLQLNHALVRIEELMMTLATLEGRQAAVRVAREEANPSWSRAEVRKFKYLPFGPSDFVSDALRELLDQAIVGCRRRVQLALDDAKQAREHCVLAEGESDEKLERAFREFKDPNAERLVRQFARAYILRSVKSNTRLREMMARLEETTEDAMLVQAAAFRSLAARLVAQRDAVSCTLLKELEAAENEGMHSVRGLQEELTRVTADNRRGRDARDAEIAELKSRLDSTQDLLRREREERAADESRWKNDVRILQSTAADLETRLADAHVEAAVITTEVTLEEQERELDGAHHRQAMAEALDVAAAQRRAVEEALNERLTANGLEAEETRARTEHLQTHNTMLLALESGMKEKIAHLERETALQQSELNAQIDLLRRQVSALRASKSVRRSLLYWSGHQVTGDPERIASDIRSLQLDDPEEWRKPEAPSAMFE